MKLRQYLLIAIVLVSLVIIIVPMFRDNGQVPKQVSQQEIPIPPPPAMNDIPEQASTQSITQQSQPTTTLAQSIKQSMHPKPKPKPKSKPESKSKPITYTKSVHKPVKSVHKKVVPEKVKVVHHQAAKPTPHKATVVPVTEVTELPKPTFHSQPATQPATQQAPLHDVKKLPPVENLTTENDNGHFAIQVASFSSEAHADGFANKLRKENFQVFTLRHHTDKGDFTRVYVGPFISAEQAKVKAAVLFKQDHIKGVVTSININKDKNRA